MRKKLPEKKKKDLRGKGPNRYDPGKVQFWIGVDRGKPAGHLGISGFENLEAAIIRGDFDEEIGIADLPEEMSLEELEELNKARPELHLPMDKYRQQQRIHDWLERNGFRYKALPGGKRKKELNASKPKNGRPEPDPPDLVA